MVFFHLEIVQINIHIKRANTDLLWGCGLLSNTVLSRGDQDVLSPLCFSPTRTLCASWASTEKWTQVEVRVTAWEQQHRHSTGHGPGGHVGHTETHGHTRDTRAHGPHGQARAITARGQHRKPAAFHPWEGARARPSEEERRVRGPNLWILGVESTQIETFGCGLST